ncbi:MAG: bifunctional folylpolyglutamate synthase/dihydrofolate synthase [Rhodobacter sp.]|nr:bifunctional folylpolyglutamate synthase/dihydrofolate synthase [Rhodobacter sp.]MCA3511806.1 bifunctional folylpolyglutamate synthase/dihydrofolate synthase [Rhodobacter sp.]MCA3520602.1 bifunctional folylpolyglutamate synthase/dihydrofolate synthase [Rhodobacter sp.]MCA3524163.1 bifunctional folylpolyglutamate synthase/dihydrofolate synthase [Rhodobacter sp.]MCA3526202.1 bifunctional folylpolyglutamate synthase/dihydrofolate synthase [Rhodobacter sp.]
MMTLHPKVIDLTLDRVHRLLSALDHPERRIPPVIHIAGTNGKGSTLAMIRAGLEAAGQPVHAYTSPHLARFHERIRLAGTLISEPALAALLDECVTANGNDPITFFEITTCAAFLAFARTPADWTLLEVGLGGRLDATNVIAAPRLTVITPVSLDHQQYLGETVAEIAGEKAGILKRRVPCIVGPQTDEGLAVIEARAARLGVPLLAHGQHWHIGEDRGRMIYQDDSGLLDLPLPNLPGPHQIQNAGAAIAALRHLGFDAAVCEAAVTQAVWPARMQRLRQGPLVAAAPRAELWLDGGHNPAGGEALAATLARMPERPTHLICGMLNTKDIGGYLRPLARHADSLTAVSIPGEKNTLPAEETQAAARAAGLSATMAGSVQDAVNRIAGADPEARILICGSLYLAGQVLRENG